MTKKAVIDRMLSKVPEDRKEAFIAELRAAKSKEERIEIAKKYDALLTQEEIRKLQTEAGNEIPDAELDQAAGGCNCAGNCGCVFHCSIV